METDGITWNPLRQHGTFWNPPDAENPAFKEFQNEKRVWPGGSEERESGENGNRAGDGDGSARILSEAAAARGHRQALAELPDFGGYRRPPESESSLR